MQDTTDIALKFFVNNALPAVVMVHQALNRGQQDVGAMNAQAGAG